MTNQNNAAQAATKDIREGFELTYAADADDPACAADLFHFTNGWRACIMSQVGKPVVMKLAVDATAATDLINAEAARLRAPVADGRAAFYINPSVIDPKTGRIGEHVKTALTWSNTKHHGWQVPVFLSPPLASAPVAGEAQPVCWIERTQLENVRDEGEDAWVYWRGTGHAAEPDEVPLYAAPQANTVAGEAQPSDADITKTVRALLNQARHTRHADGEMGVRVQDVMIARAVLARYGHTPLPMPDAVPQASAEARWIGVDLGENAIADVRNAALEEAAKLMEQTSRSSGAALIRALKATPAPAAAPAKTAGDVDELFAVFDADRQQRAGNGKEPQ